ncbi:MAG: hypothetical protein ACD_2C00192G0001, partial [uncultured bacterium (gcode 4)]
MKNLLKIKDWSIIWKIIGLSIVSLCITGIGINAYFFPSIIKQVNEERKSLLVHNLDAMLSLCATFDKDVKDGRLTLSQAQAMVKERISAIRYGDGDYYWIQDNQIPSTMIMHPTSPALNGTKLTSEKYNRASKVQYGKIGTVEDIPGKNRNLFDMFVEIAKKSGDGFVWYDWTKPKKDGTVSTE